MRSIQRRARESHQTRSRRFEDTEGVDEFHERVDSGGFGGAVGMAIVSTVFFFWEKVMLSGAGGLHFDDTIVGADIQHFSSKLVGQMCDGLEMFVFVSQRLTGSQPRWVIVSPLA